MVVLLQSRKIPAGELTLHTLADVPVNERALGVHEVKLVVKTPRELANGSGVGDQSGTLHLGKIATWHDLGGWLLIDTWNAVGHQSTN